MPGRVGEAATADRAAGCEICCRRGALGAGGRCGERWPPPKVDRKRKARAAGALHFQIALFFN